MIKIEIELFSYFEREQIYIYIYKSASMSFSSDISKLDSGLSAQLLVRKKTQIFALSLKFQNPPP